MISEIRPSQLRALLWLLVLVPLIPVGLMLRFMFDTVRADREATFERLTAIYQRTLDNAVPGFSRHIATLNQPVTARDTHTYFRSLLDRDVLVRVVDQSGKPLTGAIVPSSRAVAQVSLRRLELPYTVQVFLLNEDTLAATQSEQFRGYVVIVSVAVILIFGIAFLAALTLSRQLELRELRTTAVATVAHELRTPLASSSG